MNVTELNGVNLDYWVAKARGFSFVAHPNESREDEEVWITDETGTSRAFKPTTDPSDSSPIVGAPAHVADENIAALRAYVASKFPGKEDWLESLPKVDFEPYDERPYHD